MLFEDDRLQESTLTGQHYSDCTLQKKAVAGTVRRVEEQDDMLHHVYKPTRSASDCILQDLPHRAEPSLTHPCHEKP